MFRKEVQAYIDALTDEQLAGLKTVHLMDGAAADAMVTASNAKDATIAQAKTDFDAAAEKAKEGQQAAADAATEKAVAETTAALQPQIDALTQTAAEQDKKLQALEFQATDQKALLDKYAVLLSAKEAGPLADKLKKQAMVDMLTQRMADAQASHDKAMKDLADLG